MQLVTGVSLTRTSVPRRNMIRRWTTIAFSVNRVAMSVEHLKRSRSADQIMSIATRMFSERPYESVTVREVALQAKVDEATIYRLFGSKDGLAAGCWSRFLGPLKAAVEADLTERLDRPLEILERHLKRTAEVAVEHRSLTSALMMAVHSAHIHNGPAINPKDPRAVVPLPDLMIDGIRIGQATGAIRSNIPAQELAAFLTSSLLVRIMTRPRESADDAAVFIWNLVVQGAGVPTGDEARQSRSDSD